MDLTNAQRAEVLIHALPYIQKYYNKIIVVKYGGNAMINEDLKEAVMGDIVLLSLIGINMIRESLSKDESENPCDCCDNEPSFSFGTMLPLALATSIDALAVGVSFAALSIGSRIIAAVLFIGVITFVLSGVGVKIGNLFGAKFKSKAEFFGGAVLVGMGVKILLEGLGVIG